MTATKLFYLEDFSVLECEAKVLDVLKENERDVLILDQTVFYPQGGGQPYDTGAIESPSGRFIVEEVRFVDGVVKHIGRFEQGAFAKGETVECRVDKERRELNSRIHSAGHLVDLAVTGLNLNWVPGKGYHFPDGPYVEYHGSGENVDTEKLKNDIETRCNEIIQKGQEVAVRFMRKDEMQSVCHFVPDYIPTDKPGRVVLFGNFGVPDVFRSPAIQLPSPDGDMATGASGTIDAKASIVGGTHVRNSLPFGIPCGGTHVRNLREIKSMTIRKIKAKGDTIQVGYDVVRS